MRQSKLVKALVTILVVVPLLISSVALLREHPGPRPGPSGEDRFSQFSPLEPNYPIPPNVTPPVELAELANLTVGYADRNDVFLRLRSGQEYSDGKRLPHYTRPTASPFSGLPPRGFRTYIERNATISSLIGEALGIPGYLPSYVFFPQNASYVQGDFGCDAMRQIYAPDSGFVSYSLGLANASEVPRESLSFEMRLARSYISAHPRMLESIPRSDVAENAAAALRLPDDETVYRQVAVVLAYMYSRVRLSDVNLTNPLDSLEVGEASPADRLTTFVTLLRLVGVPANVAYGFIPENVTEDGLYVIKVRDMFLFAEIYDVNSRILFDPRSVTGLLLSLEGKAYPINVYPVEVYAETVEVSGGDAAVPVGDAEVPIFDVNSTDYENFLYVVAYASVMGEPLATCPYNATRYSLTYNETVERHTGFSNSTGFANVNVTISYSNAVPGVNALFVSYNGRAITSAVFVIRTVTNITPMADSIHIYAPVRGAEYEEVGRNYFFTTRALLRPSREALEATRGGFEA